MDSLPITQPTKSLRQGIQKQASTSRLPNLYLLLDIFNIAYPTVRAASVFRLLNKKCFDFYNANREYLLKQDTALVDKQASGVEARTAQGSQRLCVFSFSGEDESMLQVFTPFSHPKVGFTSAIKPVSLHSAFYKTSVLLFHLPRDPAKNALSDEMFRIQPFGVHINRKAITGNDAKSSGMAKFDKTMLYSNFLNEKFYYQEMYDEDYGNSKMRRLNLEELYGSTISFEFLGLHFIGVCKKVLENVKEQDELGVLRSAFEDALARNADVLANYADLQAPLCVDRYLEQSQMKFTKLQDLSLVFLSVVEFEHYLRIYSGVLKNKLEPPNMQRLAFRFESQEFKIDEYYSENLILESMQSETLREFSLEIKQLAQMKMFETALKSLCKICPKVTNLCIKNAGYNNGSDVNEGYHPVDIIKVGFENIQRLKLVKIPLKAMDFKGLIGRLHSYSPALLHLDVFDGFSEVLMDLRDFMTQQSILQTLIFNQWICCDESFCAFFGQLQHLRISLKNFTFMKRMRYPYNLKCLEVQLESLTRSFLDGIRNNAQALESLSVIFSKVEADVVENINNFQREIYKQYDRQRVEEEKRQEEAEQQAMKEELEKGLQRMNRDHNLRNIRIVSLLRGQKVTFAQIYDLVLDMDLGGSELATEVNEDSGRLQYVDIPIPFKRIETLELKNITLADPQSAIKFLGYIRANKNLRSVTLEECAVPYDFIKSDLSPTMASPFGDLAAPHLDSLSIDLGYKKFFVSDQATKRPIIGPYLIKLSVRALFDSPNVIADLLLQLQAGYRLSHLTIDYLGPDSFNNASIQAIQDALACHDKTSSLKFFTIRVTRDLFKVAFDKKLREFDLNQVRIFKIEVNED